jgi:catechol 2,3-dioxygenase-like lactoylglutathione lyase family enzyme
MTRHLEGVASCLTISNFQSVQSPPAAASFAAVLAALGQEEFFFDPESRAAGFGTGDVTGLLIFEAALGPSRLHLCFSASSAAQVAAAYAAGLKAGGRDNGGPGYRENYAPGYYAAFVFDPDGNNIEFLYRDPQMQRA